MRTCEDIYGPRQADDIEALVVAATGAEMCPCKQGRPCPLLDEDECNPLLAPRELPDVSPAAALNMKIERAVGTAAKESAPEGGVHASGGVLH